jgi:hypothetical protein
MPIHVQYLPRTGVYLYMFCFIGRESEPFGPVKIGITSNVAARMAAVQTGQHKPLYPLAVFNTPNREIARAREVFTHKQFADRRLEGEWFDLDPVKALADVCSHWRYYLQNMPDAIEMLGISDFERDVRCYRAWREYHAENSNVQRIA